MPSSVVPRVAIITRTRDRPLLLRRAIEGVLGQHLQEFVHVLVNDGGDTLELDLLLNEYRSEYGERLRVIHHKKSVGMQNASNLGIQASQSDYIAIHDDDDSWHESFLAECVARLDALGPRNACQGIATQSIRINEEIKADGRIEEVSRENYYPFQTISLYRMASDNQFPPIAFLYRRRAHETLGFFNEKFTVLGDWDFNLRFLAKYDIAVLDRPLAYYHWRLGTGSGSYANTVTAGLDEHQEKLILMQNHYLREDLAAGKSGLGHLMCQSKFLHGINHLSWVNQNVLAELKQKASQPPPQHSSLRKFFRWCWSLTDTFWPPPDQAPKAAPAPKPVDLELIRARLKGAKILSIDVFDTALLRVVNRPTDVFRLMESRVQAILGKKDLPFAKLRIQAEADARKRARAKSQSDEITITHIYETFGLTGGWAPQLMETLIALELKTEDECLYANPKIVDLISHAEEEGIPVVFISDMYLPSEIIRGFLLKRGFRVGQLFVSCEHGTSKHAGGMYEILVKALQVEPGRILHVGDNQRSDYQKAIEHGLQAVHVAHFLPRSLADENRGQIVFREGDIAASVCLGLARRFAAEQDRESKPGGGAGDGRFWKTLGYEVAGPIYFLFLHWIISNSSRDHINRLFFLSRDGYILVKSFEILKKYWKTPVEAEYLFASRRLYNLARIGRLDAKAFEFVLCPNPGLRVRDFIARCGFEAERYKRPLEEVGLGDLDQMLTNVHGEFIEPAHGVALEKFLRSVEDEFLTKCRQERELLYRYLQEKGYSTDKTAIVDVGWRASLCDSLQDLMQRRGESGNVKAYLFGSWKYAERAVAAGCDLESYFFHLDQPASRKQLVAECVEIVELLFSATHPSIIGLENKGGRIEPVYGEHEHDPQELAHLEVMRSSALAFVADAASLVPNGLEMPASRAYVEAVFDRLLRHPARDEAATLGKFQHRDGFGDKGPMRYLANPPEEADASGDNLKFEYDRSYWKAGFRALLSEARKKQVGLG